MGPARAGGKEVSGLARVDRVGAWGGDQKAAVHSAAKGTDARQVAKCVRSER